MKRIAIIGAGSVVFSKTLILDILNTPALQDVEFALMAPSRTHTGQLEAHIRNVILANGLRAQVFTTTDRREALRDAWAVIACFQIGGFAAYEMDYEIPLKYGVDQCIGDTLGPGGIFRAQRAIPVALDMARDMRELCPGALLLNYVNPMAMVCWALGDAGIRYVGLCHGVQTTLGLIAGYTGTPKAEIDYLCAGINHMAWFLKLEHRGRDLYPTLRERFERPEYYAGEKVRGEVLRHFGYMMTESTGHLSEYLPWFRSSERALKTYCDEPAFGGESGAALKFNRHVQQKYGDRILSDESTAMPARSAEYCSYILEALATGVPFRFNGNARNEGSIANLPEDCCTEVPTFADGAGLHRAVVGPLPSALAALNHSNITVQRLAVEAARTGDPELLMQACALDPLTGACLTLAEARAMATELLEAQRPWLPQFEGKVLRPTPTISIPADVQRAPAPLDPALAIAARFGELGKQLA